MVESAQRNIPWFLLGKFIIILVNIILHLLHDPFGLASSAQRKDGHQHPGVSVSKYLAQQMWLNHSVVRRGRDISADGPRDQD